MAELQALTGLQETAVRSVYSKNRAAAGDFSKLLQQAQAEKDDQKLRAACEELEAVLIYRLLEQMRATVPEDGLFPASSAEKIYRQMLDEEYSKVIARSRDNFGLAEMLYKQLRPTQDRDTV